MVFWGPETPTNSDDGRRAVERSLPVRVPLSAIFKTGVSAQGRPGVLCTVVARDGE